MYLWKKPKIADLRAAYWVLLWFNFLISTWASGQTKSVLAEGEWYKIAVTQNGVHALNASFLRKIGIDPKALNPDYIRLFGNGGRVLPQGNSAPRISDLRQNPVWIRGGEDGRFDEQDALFFYAEGPDCIVLDTVSKRLVHALNFYSDTTFYYLNIGGEAGLRIKTTPSARTEGAESIAEFVDYWYHEEEQVNLLQSGRSWWGEYMSGAPVNLTANLPGLLPLSDVVITVKAIGAAQVPTKFHLLIEGAAVGSQPVGVVGSGRYESKGAISEMSYTWKAAGAPNDNIALRVVYDKTGQANATAYLDYVSLQTRRAFKAYSKQTTYRFLPGDRADVSYSVADVPVGWQLWDVTDPLNASAVALVQGAGSKVTFGATNGRKARQYVGFTVQQTAEPVAWQKVTNQNIRYQQTPDLLIVTAPAWKAEAERLAAFRRAAEQLDVQVVTTTQIYNEFASGRPDVSGIRDFCKHLYQNNPGKLRYLLLFGDATYDYRNKKRALSAGALWWGVPVYESTESLNPLFTFSSDDYYGFLKEDDGEWVESSIGDHTLDIGIGRLPVKTPFEAKTVVDKLIHYDRQEESMGAWRSRITFVADDGDFNIHQQHADRLATLMEDHLQAKRIFVDAFEQIPAAGGQRAPAVNKSIKDAIEKGGVILNFTGHGDVSAWTDEQILTLSDIQSIRGYDNLPLLMTATCDFGRYDDPAVVSGAELMTLSPRGSAIGAITATRPVIASTNYKLNEAFYQGLAMVGDSLRLGDLMKYTKNNSINTVLNRNFALLGDPSMRLVRPDYKIEWSELPDTLKAGERVTLKGQVVKSIGMEVEEGFTGRVTLSVFDKKAFLSELGSSGPASEFKEFNRKIFEGSADVKSGRFSISFIVPLDIDAKLGLGRVSAYAVTADSATDASGQLSLMVGGKGSVSTEDKTPPKITAWLNDRSFVAGQTIKPESILLIALSDESGINLNGFDTGRLITASVNDTLILVLNDYYKSGTGVFGQGEIRFPWTLPTGSYHVVISAWDVYNNATKISLDFKVSGPEGIRIIDAVVFPNPFVRQISFKIEQNREMQDVEVFFRLFTISGQELHSWQKMYYNIDKRIEDNIKIEIVNSQVTTVPALYLYELIIRSFEDKSTDKKTGKLIHRP